MLDIMKSEPSRFDQVNLEGSNQKCGQCCRSLCQLLTDEFQKKNFTLSHQSLEDFCKCQWQKSRQCIWWLIYRWSLALSFTVGVTGSLLALWANGLWFIYLTDWGFFLCMISTIYAAVLATIYYFQPNFFAGRLYILKAFWSMYTSTVVLALLISFMYWLLIYPFSNDRASELYNLWSHAFNTMLMILDQMLVAFPIRLLHFIYPLMTGLLYAIFSLIYHHLGGVNMFGDPYIYEILDWAHPLRTVPIIGGCFILILIFSILIFSLYRFRILLHKEFRIKRIELC